MFRYFPPPPASALVAPLGLTAILACTTLPLLAVPLARLQHGVERAARGVAFPSSLFAQQVPPAPPDPGVASARGVRPLARRVRDRYVLSLPYGPEIRRAARRNGVDGLLLAAVVEVESSFDARAVSPRGAVGLMQLMPSLTRGVDRPDDPEVNLDLGAKYLHSLAEAYGGRLDGALAAYYAGPDAVDPASGAPRLEVAKRYASEVLALYRGHRLAVDRAVEEAQRAAAPVDDAIAETIAPDQRGS